VIRRAASTDLRPDELWSMTEREIELWFEGQSEKWERTQDILAWVQANLINVHVPRGKPKLTVEKVRGKRSTHVVDTRTDDEIKDQIDEMAESYMRDPEARERARDRRLARRAQREEEARFWQTPEGDRLAEQLDTFAP
jgi:hypothetical protein